MKFLYVKVGNEPKRIVMAPALSAAPIVNDIVLIVPPGEKFQVSSIQSTVIASLPLYIGTKV